MVARRLTTILPEVILSEAIETTRIHPVAGGTGGRTALVTMRPCRAPHHTLSNVALIGRVSTTSSSGRRYQGCRSPPARR
jgi:magnesium chelatase family protein